MGIVCNYKADLCRAFFHETLRVHNPAGWIGLCNIEPITIAGREIPTNTKFYVLTKSCMVAAGKGGRDSKFDLK